jgi:hypothetical protein
VRNSRPGSLLSLKGSHGPLACDSPHAVRFESGRLTASGSPAWCAAKQTDTALTWLAGLRERAGDAEGAAAAAREAADRGDTAALTRLAELRERVGDTECAERIRRFGPADDGRPATPPQSTRT